MKKKSLTFPMIYYNKESRIVNKKSLTFHIMPI